MRSSVEMIEPKEIIRTRRKTISLVIDSDGELIVRAPFFASDNQINRLVEEKQDWIISKVHEMQARAARQPAIGLHEGDCLLYLGKEYPVHVCSTTWGTFDKECFRIPDAANAGELLTAWYQKQAAKIIKPRVTFYADKMGVEPKSVKITSARTRWGSCSYANHVNFSWHLVMCPMDVIDYVVIHELCHIWHKDHSRLFWMSVAEYDADYKEHRSWLREYGRMTIFENRERPNGHLS